MVATPHAALLNVPPTVNLTKTEEARQLLEVAIQDPAQTDLHLFGTLLEFWGRENGLAYFHKLAECDLSMRRGRTLQAQILGAGEVPVAPWLYGYRPPGIKREGAPVDIFIA